jgi:hypothetical protein
VKPAEDPNENKQELNRLYKENQDLSDKIQALTNEIQN